MLMVLAGTASREEVPKLRAALKALPGAAPRPHVVTWTLESWDA
jgi:hypothetical protein